MIEAPALTDTVEPITGMLLRRALQPAISAVVEDAPTSTLGADLRFFATCYLAGFIFFLIMLT